MFIQAPKTQIDVGEIGNANTGDILFDGGEKINSNMLALYNMFGDQRFWNSNTAEGNQTIHATGYFQKVVPSDFRTPVAMGTQWDVDTTIGAANPILGLGKVGECVSFINSNGSCSVSRPIVIQPQGGSFVGVQAGLTITQPFSRVDCWCIKVDGSVPTWNYSITPLFGSREVPIELTEAIGQANVEKKIGIAHMSEYNTIKLLITGTSADGQLIRQSETNLLIDRRLKNVHSTEFAVLRVGHANEDDEIIDIKYGIGAGDIVEMILNTKYPNMRIAVKSIATQRVGSA